MKTKPVLKKAIGCLLKRAVSGVAFVLAASTPAHAHDGFEKVQCAADIPKALIGQRLSDDSVAEIESRHGVLGLKNLGGYEVSDGLFSAAWLICGKEYQLILNDRSVVRDALKFPPHSKTTPGFVGSCEVKAKKIPGTVVAVLNEEAGKDSLGAQAAWRIDEKTAKFVKLSIKDLRCARDGIITADGGR